MLPSQCKHVELSVLSAVAVLVDVSVSGAFVCCCVYVFGLLNYHTVQPSSGLHCTLLHLHGLNDFDIGTSAAEACLANFLFTSHNR